MISSLTSLQFAEVFLICSMIGIVGMRYQASQPDILV